MYRADEKNRITSFRRLIGKPIVFEFEYDDESFAPRKSRVVGNAWSFRKMSSNMKPQSDQLDESCKGRALVDGVLPKIPRANVSPEFTAADFRHKSNRLLSFRRANLEQQGDDDDAQARAAYEALMWMTYDLYNQFEQFWYARSEEERRREQERINCVNSCNDIASWAMVGCGALGLVPGGLPWVLACGVAILLERDRCRSYC
jgi:hypothetical protein